MVMLGIGLVWMWDWMAEILCIMILVSMWSILELSYIILCNYLIYNYPISRIRNTETQKKLHNNFLLNEPWLDSWWLFIEWWLWGMSLEFILSWRQTDFKCCASIRIPYMTKTGSVYPAGDRLRLILAVLIHDWEIELGGRNYIWGGCKYQWSIRWLIFQS